MSENGKRPGILSMIAETARGPFERMAVRSEIARNDRLALGAINSRIAEAARAVQPDNDQFGGALVATADLELDSATGEALRNSARLAYLKSTHMRGYLDTLGRFVVGMGPTFTATVKGEDDTVKKNIEEWWDLFSELNRWGDLEDEIPLRCWRDGESFTRFFVQEEEGPQDDWEPDQAITARLGIDLEEIAPPDVPKGMTFLRLIPPEQVVDSKDEVTHGILTSAKDVCTVLAYLWVSKKDADSVAIPAKDVQHIKINVDQGVKRGRSQLEVLLKRNTQYEQWLEYRVLLNLVRSAVVLIKKITGATATQVAAIRNKYTSEANTTKTNSAKMLKGGSTIHATDGIEYEFKSPNLQATDARHDGRSILLSEAAGVGMPEFIFTADSSNSNMASHLVSEGPAVKEFQRWQDFFEPYFRDIYRRVMVSGAEAAQIKGLSPDEAKTMPISIDWPPLLSRDELDHTKANQLRIAGGYLSPEGAAKDEGIDFAIEDERIDNARQKAVEFTAPGGSE